MKRSIFDLSPQEILALAIRVEENNAERLQSLVDLYADYNEGVSEYFSKLKQEEHRHRGLLKEKWSESYGDQKLPEINENNVREVVEAVEVENGEHILFDDIALNEALKMVYDSETAAYLFYLQAATAVKDMNVKNLFSELARMEFSHMESIPRFEASKHK